MEFVATTLLLQQLFGQQENTHKINIEQSIIKVIKLYSWIVNICQTLENREEKFKLGLWK